MDEYIKRNAVHDAVSTLKRLAWQSSTTSPNAESCVAVELDAVHLAIERISAADVRPVVKGKWTMHSDFPDRLICSKCGTQFDVWHWEAKQMHFCPNCGADMRVE
jgi:ribosomal protein S27AE